MAYSSVYVFGDSLVDAGNALGLAEWYGDLTFSDLPDGAPRTFRSRNALGARHAPGTAARLAIADALSVTSIGFANALRRPGPIALLGMHPGMPAMLISTRKPTYASPSLACPLAVAPLRRAAFGGR